jgi:pimeloyl-ACP methyl ester carboxylesterase
MQQHIQYCTTPDGVRLAYAVMGEGTPVVRTSHWFTHLEYDLQSPVFRPMLLGFSQRHLLLRYDARGNGLSQRDVAISFERWVSDLETVIDAAGIKRFALVGLSQGAPISIAYAARHPERVSHLIIYCGYARGLLHRDGNPERLKQSLELARGVVREGWGSEAESHRQFFTSQFMPDGSLELHHSLNELERMSATPEMAERVLVEMANVNVVNLLPKVRAPTLVLHVRGDLRVPFALGQEIAAGIAGAKFVPLPGRNHIFVPNEPAHREFHNAVAAFLGDPPTRGPLPGTATRGQRLEAAVGAIQRNWLLKLVVIAGTLVSAGIAFWELWRRLH